jgi:radical SAM superfamily enzyme YgiQ (UPF0313 family)
MKDTGHIKQTSPGPICEFDGGVLAEHHGVSDARPESLDVLLMHVPKFRNYYAPIGKFSFILCPPIGLLGLAHFLTQKGHPTRIVHLGVEKHLHWPLDFYRILDENRAPLVGIDLHWHFQSWDAIETAREIKRIYPGVRVVLGGFTASQFADEILRDFPFIDFIIRGDAEIPLLGLIRSLKSSGDYRSIQNLSWRDVSGVVHNPTVYVADDNMLESMCFTDFSLMKDHECFIESFSRYIHLTGRSERLQRLMFAKSRAYPVYIGRGCVHDCSYCGGSREAHVIIGGRERVALRSVDAIVSSIRDLDRYGFDCACLPLDSFPLAAADDTYVSIFEKVIDLKLSINVEVERYFLPSARFIQSFSRLPGRDSFLTISPHTQNEELRKSNSLYRYSNAALEECLDLLESHGVNSLVCFTCGLPFETRKDLEDMAVYQRRLRSKFKKVRLKTSMIEIEPGSPMSRMPERYGLELKRKSFGDYYRYHSEPGNNHWLAMGYRRHGCLEHKPLRSFFCRNFCERFGANWTAPVLCNTVAALRSAGALRIADWMLNLQE